MAPPSGAPTWLTSSCPCRCSAACWWWWCRYDTSRGISTTLPNAAAAARLRSPAPACFYFIDHKYKVIYARTTKTAGSSVTRMFGFIMNPATCL